MYRHGDVIILDPVSLPDGAEQSVSDIVAEGEATGHAHRVVNGEVWHHGSDLFVSSRKDAALTHEEHARLPLPALDPGMAYPIIIQREYDDEQEWRQVTD